MASNSSLFRIRTVVSEAEVVVDLRRVQLRHGQEVIVPLYWRAFLRGGSAHGGVMRVVEVRSLDGETLVVLEPLRSARGRRMSTKAAA